MEEVSSKTESELSLEEQFKLRSLKDNVPYNILQKLHSYLVDVKKQVEANPYVLLASIAHKHQLSKDYKEFLLDNDYVVSGLEGRPKSAKFWQADEPTVDMAVKIYQENKAVKFGEKKKEDNSGRDYYDPMIQAQIDKISGDYSTKTKSVYLYMQHIKDHIAENPTISLTGLHKVYRLSAHHAAMMKSLGYFIREGHNKDFQYEWTGGEVTLDKAADLYKKTQKKTTSIQRKNKAIRKGQEEKILKSFDPESLHVSDKQAQRLLDFLKQISKEERGFNLYEIAKKYKIHATYTSRLRPLQMVINYGNGHNPDYQYIGKEPTLEMAIDLYRDAKAHAYKVKEEREAAAKQQNKATIAPQNEEEEEEYFEEEENETLENETLENEMLENLVIEKQPIEGIQIAKTKEPITPPVEQPKEKEKTVKRPKNKIVEHDTSYTLFGFIRFRVKNTKTIKFTD